MKKLLLLFLGIFLLGLISASTFFQYNATSEISNIKLNWENSNYTIYDNSSLISFYNFDNRTALGENDTYVYDLSMSRKNGTSNGEVKFNAVGKIYGTSVFDGVSGKISTTNPIPMVNLTILAWIKPVGWGGAGFGRITDDSNAIYDFIVQFSARLGFRGGAYYSAPNSITLDTWQYVAVVLKDYNYTANNATFYINAIEQPSALVSNASAGNLLIGDKSVGGRTFNGSIDELMVFNRSLSASEIQQLYYSSLTKYDTQTWIFSSNQETFNRNPIYNYFFCYTNNSGSEFCSSNQILDIKYAVGDLTWQRNTTLVTYSNNSNWLFLNNTATTTNKVFLYGLNNALIYNVNGTTYGLEDINSNDGSINITLPQKNSTYVLNNFKVQEGVSITNSPIWFSSSTSTSKHIASNLSNSISTKVIVTIPNDCSEVSKITYKTNSGTKTSYLGTNAKTTCEDLKGSGLTLTIEPASSSNELDFEYATTSMQTSILKVVMGMVALLVLAIAIVGFFIYIKNNFATLDGYDVIKYGIIILICIILAGVLFDFIWEAI